MINVIPLNDLYPHREDEKCLCNPQFDGDVLTHNAFDGREYSEV